MSTVEKFFKCVYMLTIVLYLGFVTSLVGFARGHIVGSDKYIPNIKGYLGKSFKNRTLDANQTVFWAGHANVVAKAM